MLAERGGVPRVHLRVARHGSVATLEGEHRLSVLRAALADLGDFFTGGALDNETDAFRRDAANRMNAARAQALIDGRGADRIAAAIVASAEQAAAA